MNLQKSKSRPRSAALSIIATVGLSACAVGERPHLEAAPVEVVQDTATIPAPLVPYIDPYLQALPSTPPTREETYELASSSATLILDRLNSLCTMGSTDTTCTYRSSSSLGTLGEHFEVRFDDHRTGEQITFQIVRDPDDISDLHTVPLKPIIIIITVYSEDGTLSAGAGIGPSGDAFYASVAEDGSYFSVESFLDNQTTFELSDNEGSYFTHTVYGLDLRHEIVRSVADFMCGQLSSDV